MSDTVRFGVSISEALLEQFDELIDRRGYSNRSEAIRDLIRERLIEQEWKEHEEVVGVITLLFDHHKRHLSDELTDAQHRNHDTVLATTHVHLDRDNCLEMIAVRGRAGEVQKVASDLIGRKGVKHGKLSATSTGEGLE